MSVLALARARVEAIDQQLSRGTLLRDVPWDSNTNAEQGGTAGTSGTHETLGTRPADPSSLIEAYHERIALCLEAGDVPARQARLVAANEVGSDIEHLAGQQISHWHYKLSAVQRPYGRWFADLVASCIQMLHEDWMLTAASMGWSDVELFGLHRKAPKIRIEAQGLVTSVSASNFKAPVSVARLLDDHAVVRTGSGAQLSHQRFRTNLGPAIWDHPMARPQADHEGICA